MDHRDPPQCNYCEMKSEVRRCCASDHFICTSCLNKIFSGEQQPFCIFNDEGVNLRNRKMSDFPLVSAPLIERNDFGLQGCGMHGDMRAVPNSVCLECRKTMCVGCEMKHKKENHKHKVILGKDIEKEKTQLLDTINERLNEVGDLQDKKTKIIEEAQKRLKKEFEKEIETCIKKLDMQKDKFNNCINMRLAQLKEMNLNSDKNMPNDLNSWKLNTAKKIENISQSSKKDDVILFELLEENALIDEKLQRNVEQENTGIQSLRKQLDSLSFNFAKKFIEVFDNEFKQEMSSFNSKVMDQKIRLKEEFKEPVSNVSQGYDSNDQIRTNKPDEKISDDYYGAILRAKPIQKKEQIQDLSKNDNERRKNVAVEEMKQEEPNNENIRATPRSRKQSEQEEDSAYLLIQGVIEANNLPLEVISDSGVSLATKEDDSLNSELIQDINNTFKQLNEQLFKSITKINFKFSCLNQQGMKDLGALLCKTKDLTHLTLKFETLILSHSSHFICNSLDRVFGKDLESYEQAFSTYKRLISLDIDFNGWQGINDKCMSVRMIFANKIPGLKSLRFNFSKFTVASAWKNSITDKGMVVLFYKLSNFPCLENLDLEFKNCRDITDDCLLKIKECCNSNDTLREVNINLTNCLKVHSMMKRSSTNKLNVIKEDS